MAKKTSVMSEAEMALELATAHLREAEATIKDLQQLTPESRKSTVKKLENALEATLAALEDLETLEIEPAPLDA